MNKIHCNSPQTHLTKTFHFSIESFESVTAFQTSRWDFYLPLLKFVTLPCYTQLKYLFFTKIVVLWFCIRVQTNDRNKLNNKIHNMDFPYHAYGNFGVTLNFMLCTTNFLSFSLSLCMWWIFSIELKLMVKLDLG